MADKIATIEDIVDHIYEPDRVGRNRCVTPALLYEHVLQGETYSIEGSYADNRLVPLSKISFGADKGFTVVLGVRSSSNIFVPCYVSMDFNGSGYGHTYTGDSDKNYKIKSERVLDSYAQTQEFDGHIDIQLNRAFSSTDAIDFWLEIQDDDGWNLIGTNSTITINSGEDDFSITKYVAEPENPIGSPIQIRFSQSTVSGATGNITMFVSLSTGARVQFGISLSSMI